MKKSSGKDEDYHVDHARDSALMSRASCVWLPLLDLTRQKDGPGCRKAMRCSFVNLLSFPEHAWITLRLSLLLPQQQLAATTND